MLGESSTRRQDVPGSRRRFIHGAEPPAKYRLVAGRGLDRQPETQVVVAVGAHAAEHERPVPLPQRRHPRRLARPSVLELAALPAYLRSGIAQTAAVDSTLAINPATAALNPSSRIVLSPFLRPSRTVASSAASAASYCRSSRSRSQQVLSLSSSSSSCTARRQSVLRPPGRSRPGRRPARCASRCRMHRRRRGMPGAPRSDRLPRFRSGPRCRAVAPRDARPSWQAGEQADALGQRTAGIVGAVGRLRPAGDGRAAGPAGPLVVPGRVLGRPSFARYAGAGTDGTPPGRQAVASPDAALRRLATTRSASDSRAARTEPSRAGALRRAGGRGVSAVPVRPERVPEVPRHPPRIGG